MELNGFGISNFRSFDEQDVLLENLSKINIIIDKNNSGKSNILRFLQLLNSTKRDLNTFPRDIPNQHRRNNKNSCISLVLKGKDLIFNEDRIPRIRDFNYDKFKEETFILKYPLVTGEIELPEQILNLSTEQLMPLQSKYSSADKSALLEVIKKQLSLKLKHSIIHNFSGTIYIPHLRVIKQGHNFGDSNASINGSNIISKMFEMQNPTIGNEKLKSKFELIQQFVRELINKPDLTLEIPHTKNEIVLTIDGNRLPLESFGTGIHQLVILCSTLVIHDSSLVCIEEPEIHLHPELQRKFISFLEKTKNQYFITTHSNVFLDSRYDTSIYHVVNDGIKSTITNADRNENTFTILSDLGYHSSDILQSNGIIWVEGPSDRTYLLAWIKLINSKLIEGLHFSIMFYGGRLLSHLSFKKELIFSELIPILKLNRNAFVLMDRDGFSNVTKLNLTKRRIKDELGPVSYWVTKGKEIENYLSKRVLDQWLNSSKIQIDENKKIEDIISQVSKNKYERDKTKYSKQICQYLIHSDIDVLDLKNKLNLLLRHIEKWNK